MTEEDLGKILRFVSAAYPLVTLKEGTTEVWGMTLMGFRADIVLLAAKAHIADSEYFPTIAEMRSRIAEIGNPYVSPDEAIRQAEALLGHTEAVAENFGRQASRQDVGPVPAVDPLVREAYELVGYVRGFHKEFRDCYMRLCRERGERRLALLEGGREDEQVGEGSSPKRLTEGPSSD